MPDKKECKHPGCSCTAQEGSDYCSQYCHDARDTTEIACNCGHTGCKSGLREAVA